VNWSVPASALPELPRALAPERALEAGESFAFVTLVLFRQRGLRAAAVGWPRLSFPQCNLRLLVRDRERVPAIWFVRQLVPAWVVPLARGLGGQPAAAAMFDVRSTPEGEWHWKVHAGSPLVVHAHSAPPVSGSPRLGNWSDTVAFFHDRRRGYLPGRRPRRVETVHPKIVALPMAAEVERPEWLVRQLPEVPAERWRSAHSAFLVPSARLSLELEPRRAVPVATQAPAPG
jgi:hypothetical protein